MCQDTKTISSGHCAVTGQKVLCRNIGIQPGAFMCTELLLMSSLRLPLEHLHYMDFFCRSQEHLFLIRHLKLLKSKFAKLSYGCDQTTSADFLKDFYATPASSKAHLTNKSPTYSHLKPTASPLLTTAVVGSSPGARIAFRHASILGSWFYLFRMFLVRNLWGYLWEIMLYTSRWKHFPFNWKIIWKPTYASLYIPALNSTKDQTVSLCSPAIRENVYSLQYSQNKRKAGS